MRPFDEKDRTGDRAIPSDLDFAARAKLERGAHVDAAVRTDPDARLSFAAMVQEREGAVEPAALPENNVAG